MNVEISGMLPLIQVFDMPTSLTFYRDLLGFEILHRSGPDDNSDWVMLRAGETTFMLNTQYERDHRPDKSPSERSKWHDDTCFYFGCADPDAMYEYLSGKGIELRSPTIAAYGMKQLYVHDPDGYNLCFQRPVQS